MNIKKEVDINITNKYYEKTEKKECEDVWGDKASPFEVSQL